MSANSIATRLNYYQLDADDVAALRKNKAFLLAELPAILDDFYAHISRFDDTRKFFSNSQHMAGAKQAQLQHWATILDGTFDSSYQASITRIGETHHRIGLEPRWYIGGYSALVTRILAVVMAKSATVQADRNFRKPAPAAGLDQIGRLQSAVVKAAMLDMDFAISVYLAAGQRDLGSLAKSVLDMTDDLATAVMDLQTSAESMASAATQASTQSATVASAAEQASTNVRTVAVAADEMSASIREIGRQVSTSSEVTHRAVQNSSQASEMVQRLTQASQRVGAVVDLIANIARQTNLLALNATIEAARAGEAGKGFAVVAQEVKSLASQTSKATAEIAIQIHDMQTSTNAAVTSIRAIGEIIQTIDKISTAIAAAVEQQDATTTEIARNVQEAAEGTANVAQNVVGLSEAAGVTGEASQHILATASALGAKAGHLRQIAQGFASRVA